jgi:drug/metabolite transporter (DMT)-like permease
MVGAAGFVCYYITISYLPLGDAVTLMSIYPVLTVVMAYLFLHEAVTRLKLAAIACCLAGALLISQPKALFGWYYHSLSSSLNTSLVNLTNTSMQGADTEEAPWYGYGVAFLGSTFGSSIFIIMKRIGTKANTEHLLFSWGFWSTSVALVASGAAGTLTLSDMFPTSDTLHYAILMCVCGVTAQLAMNYSGRLLPAGPAALVRSSDVAGAYFWEVVVFHITPNSLTLIGAVLILSATCLVALSGVQTAHEQAELNSDNLSSAHQGEFELVSSHTKEISIGTDIDDIHNSHMTFTGSIDEHQETRNLVVLPMSDGSDGDDEYEAAPAVAAL